MDNFSVAVHHFQCPKLTMNCSTTEKQWNQTSVDETATALLHNWSIGNNPLDPALHQQSSRVVLVVGDFRDSTKIEEASCPMRSARYYLPFV